MKALRFELHLARLALARVLGTFAPSGYLSSLGPLRLVDVPDASVLGDRWVVVETRACGICGSDVKQVFQDAAVDNPLTAVISFPHVMGHEHVGVVVDVGKAVTRVRPGDRVACSPWLSCAVRGLPECDACRRGELPLCARFAEGPFAPGMHAGNCRDVSGGFAPYVPVHETACFPVPEAVPFSTAVLADPFAVALHAVLKAPPEPGETALVYGCGGLGVLLVHALTRLFPRTRVFAVDPRAHARASAERMGARATFGARGATLVEAVAEAVGAPVRRPRFALPWLHGGVHRVYDTVGAASTLETAVRVLGPGGTLVLVGVSAPARFEWTPLYFKELRVIGSNAYGVETLGGRRAHAIEHVFSLLERGPAEVTEIVTHRYGLGDYKRAFLTARSKGSAPSVKVVFEFA
ncbi:MAG TPA: alcohol dehydrogenase catalytic domain-containing protein [Minicystis sp.]|nr:alcohol dehydrogenase catalytic domain-containing protein [Minicystis sp.]